MKNLIRKLGSIMLVVALMFPSVSFAGTKDIYVDANASGVQDGSASHPHKTIWEAIKDAEDTSKDVEIHIASGTYRENIVVPKHTKIFGSGTDKVIIRSDDRDKAVVKLNHKSEINKVTIRKGKYGVLVDGDDRASIINCIIKDNRKDGVKIEPASVKEKYIVNITDNKIYDNGGSGIYSEKRQLSIIDNEIINNDGDGIDIEGGSAAWIYHNKVKDNDKSGLKLTLDASNIWVKSNTFRNNDREGVEVEAYGGAGRIDIKKSKLYKNDRYGIAKVQRGNFSVNVWNGLTIQEDTKFWENVLGTISSALRVY